MDITLALKEWASKTRAGSFWQKPTILRTLYVQYSPFLLHIASLSYPLVLIQCEGIFGGTIFEINDEGACDQGMFCIRRR